MAKILKYLLVDLNTTELRDIDAKTEIIIKLPVCKASPRPNDSATIIGTLDELNMYVQNSIKNTATMFNGEKPNGLTAPNPAPNAIKKTHKQILSSIVSLKPTPFIS